MTIRTLGDDRPPDTTWGEGAFVGALETALLDGVGRSRRPQRQGRPDDGASAADDRRLPAARRPARRPRRARTRDVARGPAARCPGGHRQPAPDGLPAGRCDPTSRSTRCTATSTPGSDASTRAATDALVLAVAGLTRLGRADRIGQVLPAELVPPAPGQGALAIQCRADDEVTRSWLAQLDDQPTRAAVEAEREFLARDRRRLPRPDRGARVGSRATSSCSMEPRRARPNRATRRGRAAGHRPGRGPRSGRRPAAPGGGAGDPPDRRAGGCRR